MRVCEPTGCVELAGCEWRLLRPNDPAQTIISERGALGLPPTLCVCKPCDPRCVPPLTPHCQRVLTGDPSAGCRRRAPSPGAASRRATMLYVLTARSRRRRGPASSMERAGEHPPQVSPELLRFIPQSILASYLVRRSCTYSNYSLCLCST